MTLFDLICFSCLSLAIFAGLYWLAGKHGSFHYLSDDDIKQRVEEANRAIENRPRVRAITKPN